ncbi:MAG: SusD/RagB family nutrient-binding outer membrane lipoprotein [Reichenbachiella sp.]|uniref:SusD/RagB family nutrient-binding outer membrane lipoprotein n=2 Tax=Reichenbachiella sp. TaxID=2184521 RepID=UPI0032630519
MPKIWKFYIVLSLFNSCDFGEANRDPTRETTALLSQLLPSAQTQLAHTRLALPARMIGAFVQQFRGIDDQVRDWTNYDVRAIDFNELWSEGLYAGSMKDCKLLIEMGIERRRPYYTGIGQVLLAQNLALVTSFWGDAPFSEAFSLDNLSPKYDLQKDLIDTIQLLLDAALVNFEETGVDFSDTPPKEDDLIFNGNIEQWIGATLALKARYYSWLSKRDVNYYNNVLDVLSKSELEVNWEPNFVFSSSLIGANPLALFGGGGRAGTLFIHENFINLLEAKDDPRKDKYVYYDPVNELYSFYKDGVSGPIWGRNDASVPLISTVELKFIEAEAWLFVNEAIAETRFYEAIELSMEQMNLRPEEYSDYLNQHASFNGLSTFDSKFERIINEKYIALFAQAEPEIWVDYRRTGYPGLIPVNSDGNGANPTRIVPRRFLYPSEEALTNRQNLESAIKNQGNGTALLDDEIWLFE